LIDKAEVPPDTDVVHAHDISAAPVDLFNQRRRFPLPAKNFVRNGRKLLRARTDASASHTEFQFEIFQSPETI
jgi:hypothetical protein